ncbi:MAG: hypothetical protein AB1449_11705 [Chloroflexota bacterium]
MTAGFGLIALGLLVAGMGLLDRRWGRRRWLGRFLTGIAIALGGLSLVLSAQA